MMGVVLAGLAVPAMAQDAPKVEVSGGYNLLRSNDETVPAGWYADVAGNLTQRFAIVGQLTGNYKSIDIPGGDADTSVHTFMAGVRAQLPATGGIVPFAHVLFGAARSSASTDVVGAGAFDFSTTDAALQLGGGVKLMPGPIGFKVGADYLRIFTEDEGTNAFRFSAGVVFGF